MTENLGHDGTIQSILDELKGILTELTQNEQEEIKPIISVSQQTQFNIKPEEKIVKKESPPQGQHQEKIIEIPLEKPLEEKFKPDKIEEKYQELKEPVKPEEPQIPKVPPLEIQQEYEEIPEGATIVTYAIFYLEYSENNKQKFLNSLNETIKKSTKKNIYLKKIFLKPYNLSINWDEVLSELKSKSPDVIFFIHSIKFDTGIVVEKFSKLNFPFHTILDTNLDKKITYIDLAIQIMLLEK